MNNDPVRGARYYVFRFCPTCGTLDIDPGTRVRCNIFFNSRAPWLEVQDSLPRCEAYPPENFNWQAVR